MSNNLIYTIGIGNTGAKCLESIVQITSTGILGEQEVKFLFVDADEKSRSVKRSQACISVLQNCQNIVNSSDFNLDWLKSPVSDYGFWPLFERSNDNDLSSYFRYKPSFFRDDAFASILDVFYTQESRNPENDTSLHRQLVSRAEILNRTNLNNMPEEPWASLVTQIKLDIAQGTQPPKILLLGSIFEGTSASGIPTLGRLLSKKLEREGVREVVSIGAVLMLPYFNFVSPSGEDALPDDEILASSDQFLLNIEGSLKYYSEKFEGIFDITYLVKSFPLEKTDKFVTANKQQRNSPHFLEVYAAMACIEFQRSDIARKDAGKVLIVTIEQKGCIAQSDFPWGMEFRQSVLNTARFSFVWLFFVAPSLQEAMQNEVSINLLSWLFNFYKKPSEISSVFSSKEDNKPDLGLSEEHQKIKTISSFCNSFWEWLYSVHSSEREWIEYINLDQVKLARSRKDQYIDILADLDLNDNSSESLRSQEIVSALLEGHEFSPKSFSPPIYGTTGLACSLYRLLQI